MSRANQPDIRIESNPPSGGSCYTCNQEGHVRIRVGYHMFSHEIRFCAQCWRVFRRMVRQRGDA